MHSGGSLGKGSGSGSWSGSGRGSGSGGRVFYSVIAEQGSKEDIAFEFCFLILFRGSEGCCGWSDNSRSIFYSDTPHSYFLQAYWEDSRIYL